ncbi:MAG: TolC family protein [Bryobacterales bacterium]|nr:TolC family protein [Bryobacterales bacterium]
MFIHLVAGIVLAAAPSEPAYSTHGDNRLEVLIEEALQNNPAILQAFADYQAALHRVPQATALPDPTLSVTQFARSVETRVGSQQRMLSISQSIPGLGKRTAKGQLAIKSASVGDEMYKAAKAEIVLRIKHAYYDLGFLDLALEASRQDEALLEHFEELARHRYAQGFGLQGDAIRLQVQITQAMLKRRQLMGQRIDLEASLNALRDVPADTPVPDVRLAELPHLDLEWESLFETGRLSRPEIRASLLRTEKREKSVHLAKIQHRPDFTLGLTWGNIRARGIDTVAIPILDNGKDSYGLSVGLTLPLFRGKYAAAVREASEQYSAARFAYRDSVKKMEAEVRSISFRIETITGQIDLYRRTLVPQAEQALRSTEAAYSNGTVEVTGLLDIQRMLIDVQLGLARLQSDYLKAVADLERAIGAVVPEEESS